MIWALAIWSGIGLISMLSLARINQKVRHVESLNIYAILIWIILGPLMTAFAIGLIVGATNEFKKQLAKENEDG